MTLDVHFGGTEPIAPLPFTCRMLQDISVKDATLTSYPALKDGKGELLVPVGLPDEGLFDWLDMFLEKNPGYTELSDRMILAWAEQSGIWRQRGYKTWASNDKPEMAFGIKELDDGSVRRMLLSVAPLQARNFVLPEVRGGLIKEERALLLSQFPNATFKRVGTVIVGEPTAEFKKRTAELFLKQKQEQADAEFRQKKAEEKRKKLQEKRQKQIEKAKKKAEKEKKKMLAAAKRAKVEAEKKKEKKDEKEEEKKEGEKEEENAKEEEEKKEEPPKVELTAEEKALKFRPLPATDLTPQKLSESLGLFSLPEKEDGFDEIKYEWSKAQKAQEYVKAWVLSKKRALRVEGIVPSDWAKQHLAKWQKTLQRWRARQVAWKAACAQRAAKKEAEKKVAAAKVAAAKAAAAKKEAEKKENAEKNEEAKEKDAATKKPEDEKKEAKEGEPVPMEEDGKGEEKEKEAEKAEEKEMDPAEFEQLDIFSVGDVMDVGGGMPLFKDFQEEDWALANLRFELHLLAHAFGHDVEDKERVGITMEHLGYYYSRYYKKAFVPKHYGVEGLPELLELVNDTVYTTREEVLSSLLHAEMESPQIFVLLAEEARRYRSARIALGEEVALKVSQVVLQAAGAAPKQQGSAQQRIVKQRAAKPVGMQQQAGGAQRAVGKAGGKGGAAGGPNIWRGGLAWRSRAQGEGGSWQRTGAKGEEKGAGKGAQVAPRPARVKAVPWGGASKAKTWSGRTRDESWGGGGKGASWSSSSSSSSSSSKGASWSNGSGGKGDSWSCGGKGDAWNSRGKGQSWGARSQEAWGSGGKGDSSWGSGGKGDSKGKGGGKNAQGAGGKGEGRKGGSASSSAKGVGVVVPGSFAAGKRDATGSPVAGSKGQKGGSRPIGAGRPIGASAESGPKHVAPRQQAGGPVRIAPTRVMAPRLVVPPAAPKHTWGAQGRAKGKGKSK